MADNVKRTMKFINRENEIEELNLILDQLKTGLLDFPIIEFEGIGGIGKTALFYEIWGRAQELGIPVAYIDLSTLSSLDPSEFISFIINEIVIQSQRTSGKQNNTSFINTHQNVLRVENLNSNALILAPSKILVMLDSLDKVQTTFIEELGSSILIPLFNSNSYIFFIANREKTRWGTNQYRIGRKTKLKSLGLFNIDSTREQLEEKRFGDFVDQIMAVTNGHPESNDIVVKLLTDIERVENISIRSKNFGDYEKRLIDAVLENIKKDNVVPQEHFRKFYILSVFRFLDVTIPSVFLDFIDNTVEWNNRKFLDLLGELQFNENIISWKQETRRYEYNGFLRRLFSLHMRVFFPEQYLLLSRAALKHFDESLRASVNTNNHRESASALIEKIYHSADIYRLVSEDNSDLQISLKIKKQLIEDLELVVPGGSAVTSDYRRYKSFKSFEERLITLEDIKQRILRDSEIHERIGDLPSISSDKHIRPEKFLHQIVSEYEQRFLSSDSATLEILRAFHLKEDTESEEYIAAFITRTHEPINTTPFKIAISDRDYILSQIKRINSIKELRGLGSWIYSKFLRDEVRNLVNEQISLEGSLTISVDDTAIPWELMHDDEDFIALKIAVGKRFRTAEPIRSGWGFSGQQRNKCLIVGIPETSVEGYRTLNHVTQEVESLIENFKEWDDIEFDPGKDILFGTEATGIAFETRLLTGEYRIIHFAGHAYHETGISGSTSAGLVMFDRLIELDDIKQMNRGRPFVFLNGCQSAFEDDKKVEIGYTGLYTIGIASAFMLSGAIACIGNVWPVADEKAKDFALSFYEELKGGKSLGETLRIVKQNYALKFPPSDHPDDLTWLAYILYGEPTQKLFPA